MSAASPEQSVASSDQSIKQKEAAQASTTAQTLLTQINDFRKSADSRDFDKILETWAGTNGQYNNIAGEAYSTRVAKDLVKIVDESHDPTLPYASFDGENVNFTPTFMDDVASYLPKGLMQQVYADGQIDNLFGGGEGHATDVGNKIVYGTMVGGGGGDYSTVSTDDSSDMG